MSFDGFLKDLPLMPAKYAPQIWALSVVSAIGPIVIVVNVRDGGRGIIGIDLIAVSKTKVNGDTGESNPRTHASSHLARPTIRYKGDGIFVNV
ncbi:MAG: hypothetical protein A4E65_02269 [Syntrophorhabdus sp. PtaU1.Bin153]|nr:MAG: hypothetical protein A4E65_02269 [Syntrophorhabdus sp. PtaU1.Bin153]